MIFDTIYKLLTDSLLNCTELEIPTAKQYLYDLSPTFLIGLTIASVLSLTTLVLGILHLLYIGFYISDIYRKGFIFYLAGTAPFVSTFSMLSMLMPRIWFLAHLLSFLYFAIALHIIIRLLMSIVNGRQAIVKKITQNSCSTKINVQTPPFCCVFKCLPKVQMEVRRIRLFEIMVMQTPCVRLIATIVSLVLFFEYQNGSLISLKILDFVAVPSLLLGIYGCHILVTIVSKLDELCPYRYIVVFRLLDIYFAFFGLQQPIFDFMARAGAFSCGVKPLAALDTAYFWKNFATVCESFIVSVISTVLLKPSRSALFDKYPSVRSMISTTTLESRA